MPRVPLRPKILTALAEGYDAKALRADLVAGLTVAIVALPLSMAIAIASGVGPERGLVTSIVGGALVSAFGGSRFQIGGPAGAFIVLVAACVMQSGVEGLILATMLSGMLMMVFGFFRLGSYIRFMPYPVTVGFTTGIGVIILASQFKDMFGLSLPGGEPGPILPKVAALWAARDSASPMAIAVAIATMAIIVGLKRFAPRLPALLIAVAVVTLITALAGLPVETIASKFGELPRFLPAPALPDMGWDKVSAALPWALSFTLLGAIESLLSAMVADGMSGGQHRSDMELIGQGIANIGSALFGGICVTGTIARTATNVRSGARSPIAGIAHSAILLATMMVAAPLAGSIPLAALAGLLGIVAWNMIERHEFAALTRASRGDAMVLWVTFLVVTFRDLAEGIVLGFALGGLVFIRHMAELAQLREGSAPAADNPEAQDPDVLRYRLHGMVFFGSVARLGTILTRIAQRPRMVEIDVAEVSFIDSTGVQMIATLAKQLQRRGGALVIVNARPDIVQALNAYGLAQAGVDILPAPL
jgi:SulP family sulfate permease